MDELVKELKNIVIKKDVGEDYLLMNSKYVPIKIDYENFHDIKGKSSKKILFVDGGNGILFESADFCIALVRIGGVLYSHNKRVNRNSEEFYLFIKDNAGKYSVRTYPETSFNNMLFDPEDESLKNGLERCNLSRIVSVIRRFGEIDYAYSHASDADYIILDGSLESRYPLEDKYLMKLFSTGKACALSKTCTLTTKSGLSITKKLLDLGSQTNLEKWYYHPIVVNNNPKHSADMYFIKLNAKTSYVFRFEIQNDFKEDVDELLAVLVYNSNDPIFLGYPYGLIDVDQYVRVSEDESRILQTKISTKLGKDWNELSRHLNSMNAHSVLDKIKF